MNTMNLQVLQRMDPEIEEVLRAVSHVALYQLDVKKMEWVRASQDSPSPAHTTIVHDPSTFVALAPSARTDVQLRWRGRRSWAKHGRAGLGTAAAWEGQMRVMRRCTHAVPQQLPWVPLHMPIPWQWHPLYQWRTGHGVVTQRC